MNIDHKVVEQDAKAVADAVIAVASKKPDASGPSIH
jgi:hypothetical protein